jgi:hypothetical protein
MDILLVAASSLAWPAADARPDKVGRTVLIGGAPGRCGLTPDPLLPGINRGRRTLQVA